MPSFRTTSHWIWRVSKQYPTTATSEREPLPACGRRRVQGRWGSCGRSFQLAGLGITVKSEAPICYTSLLWPTGDKVSTLTNVWSGLTFSLHHCCLLQVEVGGGDTQGLGHATSPGPRGGFLSEDEEVVPQRPWRDFLLGRQALLLIWGRGSKIRSSSLRINGAPQIVRQGLVSRRSITPVRQFLLCFALEFCLIKICLFFVLISPRL